MKKTKVFYPVGIENIWHHSSDGQKIYRLDGIEKLVRLRTQLEADPRYEIIEVSNADTDLLRLVHSNEYVDALITGNPKDLAESSGFIWQPQLVSAFANSAQSLIQASRAALNGDKAGTISKGGHHAIKSRGFGFNPVNEIAICITKLQQETPELRIAVIDLDIHFGNGLNQILAGKHNTILLDIWSKKYNEWGEIKEADNVFPFRVMSLEEYWLKLETVISKVNKFTPDLVIYHSGMDIYQGDRLGGIAGFNEQAIERREKFVIDAFKNKFVLVLGGGYVDHTKPDQSEGMMRQLVNLHKLSFELLN